MQIHELNSFQGSTSNSDYLAIDTGDHTLKIPAPDVGITTAMTQAEATAGTSTSKRVITPKVLKTAIDNGIDDAVDSMVTVDSSGVTNGWNWTKWSDGRYEAEKVINMGSVTASTVMVTIEGSVKLYMTPALPSDPSQSDYQPPHNYISGTMVYDVVDNSSGYMFPIKTTSGRVQIGRFATAEFTFSNVILTAKLVGGRWK